MKKISLILFQIGILTFFLSATISQASAEIPRDGNPIFHSKRMTGILPSVSTKILTDITATSVSTGGNVLSDGGEAVTARGVCWSTEAAPTIADSHTVDGSGTGSFNSFIEGLTPGQTYHVRAYATNSLGTSYGQELQFTTPCLVVTWDTLHLSPNDMPYTYADTVLQVGTPDSAHLVFHNETAIGCDSISNVIITYKSITKTACRQFHWWVSGQTYTSSGMYLHPYRDANGDPAADTLYLTIQSPSVSLGNIAAVNVCEGEAIAISANATGNGNITYGWTGPGNFTGTNNSVTIPNAAPANSGTYTVTAVATEGQCTDTATRNVVVTVNPTPNVSISGGTAVCTGSSATLTASGAVSYRWNTGASAPSITVTPDLSTTYTVIGTNAYGCSATTAVTVTVNPLPNVGISGGTAVCTGSSTTLTASGAVSYRWNTGASAPSITVTPALSTTYTVTGTDAYGCSATAAVTVTVNPLPNVGISGNNAICEGKSTTLTATGASSYTWSNGSTSSSITETPATGTTYFVTGTNIYGCSATASMAVTVNPIPDVSISGTGNICLGESVSLTASGAHSYQWSTGASGASITHAPTGNTTYSVTGTSSYGCTATASTSVTVNPLPNVSVSGGTSICQGGSVTLTAAGASTYFWIHGKTGTSITETPTASTSYIVQGTDANGCTATASAQVTVFALPSVYITGPGEICENESVTLTATGASTYSWSNGSSGNSITETPVTSTTYSVTGTDINHCQSSATVHVTVDELPVVTISGDDDICDGENSLLVATGAKTYVWNDGSTGSSLLVEPDENTTYSVVGTDKNGCVSETATFTVEVGEGDDDEVSVTACELYFWHTSGEFYRSSGTYVYNYMNDANCLSHHVLHLTITHADTNETSMTKCDSYTWGANGQTYTESGTYFYTHTNANNCETIDILNLTINHGEESEETVSECENYRWPTNGQTYTQSGDYVFEYTGPNGCPSTKTLHLTIKHGSQEEVSASSVNSYTWDANGETYTQSGNYLHHFTNEEGCESTLTLHLIIHHEPDSDCIRLVMERKESCSPGEDGVAFIYIPVAIKNRCEVEWQLPGGISHDERVTNLKKGTYHVKVKGLDCPDAVFFQGSVEILREDGCDVEVHISGPTNVQGDCNGIPPVTFTAHASGGVPPYSFPGWQMVGSNTATKTFTPSEGRFAISCTAFDSENNSGSDYLDGYAKKLECAKDPNEIKGPNGYSEEMRFVNNSDKMSYTIEFENDPDFAMAPASRVKITYDVPAQQRIASFRLADFGFGSFIFTVPSNLSSYSQRLDVSDSLGVWVDVNAGIDVVNHQLFWIFQSIDPATGAEPASSQMGFLPINDSLEHGQGYVSFYILPDNSVQTGDTVAAKALIVFDENESISTNVWRNTFDVVAPTSTLHAELNAQDSLYCTFSFTAQDDAGGSGVANVETFVSVNNNSYTSIGSCHPDSTLSYALENGLYYQFLSIATDNVGNTEAFKTVADTAVNYNTAPVDLVLDGTVFYENVPLNTYIGTLMTLDDDINQTFVYELVGGDGSTDNGLFQIVGNELRTNSLFECSHRTEYSVRIKSTDIGGLSIEKAFFLNEILTHETPITYLNFAICQGDSFDFHGQPLTTEGVYTDTLARVDGCDSIVTLFLSVNPVYHATIADEICSGGSYSFFDTTLTTAGTYAHTLQTIHGCDSVITLNLTVNPDYNTPVAAAICDGDIYNFYGRPLTASGTYTQTLQSIHGCDSVITLTLTVNPVYNTPVSHTICQGDSYNFFDTTLTAAGVYSHTLQTVNGCDSIITLTLTVNPVFNTPIAHTMCQGDSYNFFDTTLTTAGVYSHTLQTVNGCDSVISLTLTVNPVYNIAVSQDICQGGSFNFNGEILTEPGTYFDTLQTVNGCDSIISLTLNVHQVYNIAVSQDICQGGSFNFNGDILTQAGTYTDTLESVHGCDSIVTLTLAVNPVYNTPMAHTMCQGDSYNFFDTTLTTAGVYSHTLQTVNGCDSVITLTLMVNPVYNTPITHTMCQGESYNFFGEILTSTGSHTHTLQTINGCDSVIALTLIVNPVYDIAVSQDICQGETFNFNGRILTNSGTYIDTLQTVNGCDSVITLTLTMKYGTHNVETETACESYTWHGTTHTTSGTYTYAYSNADGCASVDTLHLTVNYGTHNVETETACESYTWHGTTYTTSGTYTYAYSNAAGCASVDTLHLTVNYGTHNVETETACESYTWHGTTHTTSGTYTYAYSNAAGCASVDTLHLTVTPVYNIPVSHEMCQGESFNFHGTTLTTAGTYVDTLQTVSGCDSVVTLVLTVHPTYTVDVYDTAMLEHEYVFGDFTLTPHDTGVYTYDFQYSTVEGCDSLVHLILLVKNNDGVTSPALPDVEVYPNPAHTLLNIKGEGMRQILIYNADGKLVFTKESDGADLQQVDVSRYASGHYLVKIVFDNRKTVTCKVIVGR